jgi:nucleoside-diphosphate-sugar epimerase
MKVLVTGGAGFVGSILVRRLLNSGHHVRVLDNIMFTDDSLKELVGKEGFEFIKGDIRDNVVIEKAVSGCDAVVHLAAIVGDAACDRDPKLSEEVNVDATIDIVNECVKQKVERFIFASSCIVYGKGTSDIVDENSKVNPISLYGKQRLKAEEYIKKTAEENKKFSPVILRLPTIYGLSPRMRFDLVVNILAMHSATDGKIKIFGGEQWRPLINVEDVARAIQIFVEAPVEKIKNEVFNVGTDSENYKIIQLGEIVKKCLPEVEVEVIKNKVDEKSYRVSFKKIYDTFGFKTEKKIEDAIVEIYNAIKSGEIKDPSENKYYDHKW